MNKTGDGIAPSAIPWQVSITNHWKPHFCSGVILDHKTVLSSAGCFKKLKTLKGIRVMAGDVNYKVGQNIGVRKLRFLSHNEDLVILKLVSSLHINENVLPACLPTFKRNKQCYFSGWGENESLKWANIEVGDKCSQKEDILCTTNANQGLFGPKDGGGPLICTEGNNPVLIGIATSISSQMTFSTVESHITWILQNMVRILYFSNIHI